jgi:phospholipase D1/2
LAHQDSSFIREGETCWRKTRADRAALLIDAAAYFGALRASMLEASRSILIAGWDIDSRAPIRGEAPPDDGAPLTLGPLLTWLVDRRPELVVRVLLWDYSLLYAFEREPLPRLNLDWKTPRRVQVRLDNHLPFGASHHEKLAVIDDRVAFCGGIDLTTRRWDTPAHRPDDPQRHDPNGEAYSPFHDAQIVVDGDAARLLGDVVRERWDRLSSRRLRRVDVPADPWPAAVEPDFRDVEVGVARTRPAYDDETELRQVEAAYLDAIARAERLIYIENQYLTADSIARALGDRLRERDELELVIVNTEHSHGWLEAQTMGNGRAWFVRLLQTGGTQSRVRVLYPWVADGDRRVAIKVHAKLMVVDDRLLHVGSSNLNARSMGVDRECDLLVEASNADQAAAVRRLRLRLLAHFCGVSPGELGALEEQKASLIAALDAQVARERGLGALPTLHEAPDVSVDLLVDLADPERPIDPEYFVGDLFGAEQAHPIRRHLYRLLGAVGAVGIALAVWHFAPVAEWSDPERLAALLERVSSNAWAGPIVFASFIVGSFCLFPVTALIAATAVALDPVSAFVWALAGALASATLNFACGRGIAASTLENWFGAWIGRINARLRRGGIVPVMVLRNVPVAPFTVINVVAGAARIRFRDFLIGTVLGMAPGMAALTILGDRLRGVFESPSWLNVGLLVLAVIVWIGIALGLQALSNRLADER